MGLGTNTQTVSVDATGVDQDIPASDMNGVNEKPQLADDEQKPFDASTTINQNIYSANPLEIESMLKAAVDEEFEHVDASKVLNNEQIYETISEFNDLTDEANSLVYSTPTNKACTPTSQDKANLKQN